MTKQGIKKLICCIIMILIVYTIYKQTRFYYYEPIYIPFGSRLNKSELMLVVGESYRLRIIGINKRARFSSTDMKVADVRFDGNVTAYRPGTAIINVKMKKRAVQCRVTVIAINKSAVTISVGKQARLKIKGTGKKVVWSSMNKSVVEVEENGTLTGKCKGKTVVVGEVNEKKLKCTVTVK